MTVVMGRLSWILIALGAAVPGHGQTVRIQPAEPADFAALVDSNSPAYWSQGKLYLFNSLDVPVRSEAVDTAHFVKARAVFIEGTARWRWIEAAWADAGGTVYAWYHAEPLNVCPGLPLTAPQIGAMVSSDGVTFRDLGIVLKSNARSDCGTKNIYFAGGNGDFSVIPDRDGQFFYFLFTNYGGLVESQGIAAARMAFEDRSKPAGHVWKFHDGDWSEPGLGGQVTPVFAARGDWSSDSPDSYWGPAVHWNTALQQYVVLMNHVSGDASWTPEGLYVSFTPDLSNPWSWTSPVKLMDVDAWYPEVIGYGPGETDTMVGARARLYLMGHSEWDLIFEPGGATAQAAPVHTIESRRPVGRH